MIYAKESIKVATAMERLSRSLTLAAFVLCGISSLFTPAFAGEPAWWTQMKRDCRQRGGEISEYYNNYNGCHLPTQQLNGPSRNPKATDDLNAGLAAEGRGDWSGAVESYASARAEAPDDLEIQSRLQNARRRVASDRLDALGDRFGGGNTRAGSPSDHSRSLDEIRSRFGAGTRASPANVSYAARESFVIGTCAITGDPSFSCRDSGTIEAVHALMDAIEEEAVGNLSKSQLEIVFPSIMSVASEYKKLKEIEISAINMAKIRMEVQFDKFKAAHSSDRVRLTEQQRMEIAISFAKQIQQWRSEAVERANSGISWSQVSNNRFAYRSRAYQQVLTISRDGAWQGH